MRISVHFFENTGFGYNNVLGLYFEQVYNKIGGKNVVILKILGLVTLTILK